MYATSDSRDKSIAQALLSQDGAGPSVRRTRIVARILFNSSALCLACQPGPSQSSSGIGRRFSTGTRRTRHLLMRPFRLIAAKESISSQGMTRELRRLGWTPVALTTVTEMRMDTDPSRNNAARVPKPGMTRSAFAPLASMPVYLPVHVLRQRTDLPMSGSLSVGGALKCFTYALLSSDVR
jgi:hypothetical protein